MAGSVSHRGRAASPSRQENRGIADTAYTSGRRARKRESAELCRLPCLQQTGTTPAANCFKVPCPLTAILLLTLYPGTDFNISVEAEKLLLVWRPGNSSQ